MTENKKKGLILILLGVFIYLIFPTILKLLIYNLLNLHYDWSYMVISFIPVIVSIGLIIFGVITLVKKPNETNEIMENLVHSEVSGKHNKVVTITLWGGLLGLFASTPKQKIAKAMAKENLNGFRTVQIIEAASGNILLWLLRLIILFLTLFIYTPANGYYITFEKIKEGHI
ncbi:MAG: hypothetical protein RBT49_13560 [Bacteroidales bacterium]|jgi:hypothetical protein|nr:hypothetical protein [Bacteroidales bacterium]